MKLHEPNKKISNELQSIKINANLSNVNKTSCAASVKAQGVKLSKFSLTSFNPSLNAIEKFTYLKGQLGGPAADCIQGITSKNLEEGKQLLQERFANPQVIISAHMNVLLKLPEIMIVYHVYLPFIIQLKAIFAHF